MNLNIKKAMVGVSMLFACSANASLLSFNGDQVGALDLNGQYSSFNDFYDYNSTANKWSSNTGFEIANTAIMLLAELNGEYALITTIGGLGGGAGGLFTNIIATSGSATFADDPDEISDVNDLTAEINSLNSSGLQFDFMKNRTDGFIFSELTLPTWSVTTMFTNVTNIDGLKFVSFDDGTKQSGIYSSLFNLDNTFTISASNDSTVSTAVSAPFTSLLVLLSVFGLLLRRKQK